MENATVEKAIEKKTKPFVKLGYSKLETAELVTVMNELLANYSVHYQKLRNFHWNVKGPDFFDIHEKFEDQYNKAKVAIDDIAERIRVFGQTPLSTMKDYLEVAVIKESDTNLPAMDMVAEILNDYTILLEHMFNTVEMAIEHGDSGTEDMVKGFIKEMEKDHWMFTAFSSKQ
ncbi:DNA starvation/stationary phase protection protein [Fulvivirga sp. M361]|uniref:Dps family protein n=1 Tax=Fulvivirga sp. M361 TaxID=2594266 RepID=UPI00117A1E19|nr:DNA starvation/stationary phase protection protein [Fulvivirga sp. M361]TRX60478.1 DNA starvation/stationary phase protection protein [Fulvivirga sp. M361]